ncbi:hypothetical protein Hypma_016315 [Hypsizygus marmoreus]|uniref:Aprataxin and PNK-like factor PBZ domain-containing protein n=1 Tax=Hypsizygus marmoreus TaxID=39966 RepID=A0A369IYI1_HYPMA|nr:hypothetical protein Hypma_016315 [Hypsizygus marmoreus]
MILASKSFYAVFNSRPQSIIRAVACNALGPALPHALHALRFHTLDSEDKTEPLSPINDEEICGLAANASVAEGLEDLFSSRHKDRNFQTSQLNSTESFKFNRAIYRLILFSRVFPVYDLDFDPEPTEQEVAHIQLERKLFLLKFPDCELFELRSVALFMVEIAEWAQAADSTERLFIHDIDIGDLAHIAGPAKVLDAYRTGCSSSLRDTFNTTTSRNLETAKRDAALRRISLAGHFRYCTGSGQRLLSDFDLWNETSWEYLRGIFPIDELLEQLPGRLYTNNVEMKRLHEAIHEPSFTFPTLLREIHELRTSEYETWTRQDWLCECCIDDILGTHLHLWLSDRNKQKGIEFPKTCQDGYKCKLQDKKKHSKRYNHLCEPQ